jgi:hypothetical protein
MESSFKLEVTLSSDTKASIGALTEALRQIGQANCRTRAK